MSSLAAAAIIQLSVLGAQEADFDRAYQQSATTGKSLVVLIGADWCPACQRMKNSVLPQVAKDGGLSNVVFTCVDFDRQRELASRLSRAKSIPQLIRFDQTVSGWKEQLLLGAKTPTEVEAFVNAGVTVPSQEDEAVDLSGTPQTDDYKRAYNRSLTTGRPLLVLLGAQWCPACQRMKNSTLPEVAEAGGMENLEFAYVDFDLQRNLANRLSRGKSIPQLIWMAKTQTGWDSRVLVGAKSSREVRSFIDREISNASNQDHRGNSSRGVAVPDRSRWTSIFSALNLFPTKRDHAPNEHTR